ncbi:YceI family protein [Bacteroidota bacterium]
MKNILLLLSVSLLAVSTTFAQKQFTRSAKTRFFSDTELEKIEATNHQVTSIVDLAKNEMVFSVLMKSFEFEKALMQEHFNEKYVESDKFPKAQFKGKYTSEKPIDLKQNGNYPVSVKGTMSMHGVNKEVVASGTFSVTGGKMSGKAVFKLKLSDFDIEIPGVVSDKIAEELTIYVDASYEPYAK